jgi:hypothetical protein
MDMKETLEWQRHNSERINRLAKLGDALAKRLIEAYRFLYDHRLDPRAQEDWLKVCDDYARRELTQTTRRILQDRYGHKIPKTLRRLDS